MLGKQMLTAIQSMMPELWKNSRGTVRERLRNGRGRVKEESRNVFQTYRLFRRENRNTYIRRQTDPATTTQLRCLLFPRKVERERQNPENPQNPLHSLRSFHSRPKPSLSPSRPPHPRPPLKRA